MTDHDLIIAVAKLDGYDSAQYSMGEWILWKGRNATAIKPENIYTTSRDAIIPVIEKQHYGGKIAVIHHLHALTGIVHGEDWRTEDIVAMLFATPKQLCIALLKATGNYHD